MGVKTIRKTEYECDGCGHKSEDEFARGGSSRTTTQIARKAYDGATGGATREEWFCGKCSEDIENFKRSLKLGQDV